MVREIGGFFASTPSSIDAPQTASNAFTLGLLDELSTLTLSGRTALGLALRDLHNDVLPGFAGIRRVYVPSYTCSAVLAPLLQAGYSLQAYGVELSEDGVCYSIDADMDTDLFVATSYFGFESTSMDQWIGHFRSRGVSTLEDATHRLLSEVGVSTADYSFGSLRKWFPVPMGGFIRGASSRPEEPKRPPGLSARFSWAAMQAKQDFLSRGAPETIRDVHLSLGTATGMALDDDYDSRQIDDISRRLLSTVDVTTIRAIRQENADYLIDGLQQLQRHGWTVWPRGPRDAPLCVPLFVRRDERDALVAYLRCQGVFTPVHWPRPSALSRYEADNDLYSREVSLVCDQRYGRGDMARTLDLLRGWMS